MSVAARLRPVFLGALAASLVVGVALVAADRTIIVDAVKAAVSSAQGAGVSGWIAFVCLQTMVAVVGIVPASVIGIAAGAIYGLWVGFLLAAASTLLGAGIAFWLSRSVLRHVISNWGRGQSQLVRLQALFAGRGWRFVCLVRMSPLMPFAATSYALALLPISLRTYFLGTLAALPSLFGCVLTGHFATATVDAWHGERSAQVALLIVGGAATLLVMMQIGRVALKALAAGQRAQPKLALPALELPFGVARQSGAWS
jgi:uncharacterized membrane protein YdjX (TVP38/TMEM64 family)